MEALSIDPKDAGTKKDSDDIGVGPEAGHDHPFEPADHPINDTDGPPQA